MTILSYKDWAHLTCDDGDLEALHKFALEVLGLKRGWFQDHPTSPHYDITPNKRRLALENGATFVTAREQAKARIEKWRNHGR